MVANTTEVAESAEAVAVDVVEEAASAGVTDVSTAIKNLNNPDAGFYSSIKGTDFESKKAIAKALTTSEPLDEHINEPLDLVNYIVLPVELANKDTGIVNTAPRITLIMADGKAYHATSVGILSSLRNLNATLGEPHEWPEPVRIIVAHERGNNGYKYFTINMV